MKYIHSPLDSLILSYFALLECQSKNGIPKDGSVMAAKATQSS